MNAPANIVGITIEHRTSEDWLLILPMLMGATTAETAAALAGAEVQCRLAGKTSKAVMTEIVFSGLNCRVEADTIILEAASNLFTDKAGHYEGEVLVRLSNGFDFVSHVIELDLKPGLGWLV